MGMAAVHGMSLEEFLALPDDGQRHELLHGVHIVTPAPRLSHDIIRAEFDHRLHQIAATRDDVIVLGDQTEVHLEHDTVVQPDVVVFPWDRKNPPRSWTECRVPLLAVEVLSPSTAALARGKRRVSYLARGIEEYWIVDLEAHAVERWRQGFTQPEIVSGDLAFALSVGLAGTINLREVFARIES